MSTHASGPQMIGPGLHDPEESGWAGLEGPCGWVMLLCAIAVVGSEWTLMTDSLSGQNNGYVDTAAAIFLGLAGLRCAFSPGQHPRAGIVGALAGVGLVLQAIFASDEVDGLMVIRYGAGGIAIAAGLTVVAGALATRRRA